jgi:hypothetical protein
MGMPKINTPDRVPLAFRVPSMLNRGLRDIAESQGRKLTAVVEEALVKYWLEHRVEEKKEKRG